MSWDMELNSFLENINSPSLLGQDVLEPWQNGGGDDCEKAMKVPNSCEGVIERSSTSSFSDTGENAVAAASFGDQVVDQVVEPRMFADSASSSMCVDWHEPLLHRRKKKKETTARWRRFISPVMSRCKWVELRLKQLKSQERKYNKELATLDSKPHMDKHMKRKRRKRVEENCDLASHMSNHTLFSYYEKADCNVDAGLEDYHEIVIGGDGENLVELRMNDLWFSVGSNDYDKSWNDTIQKIIALESQLQNLKSRHDKVISENPGRFCSINQLSMLRPCDGYNHPDIKPDSFTGNASSGDDMIVPLSEASDRPKMDDPRDNINVEDLTQYQVVKEELHELENVGNQLVKQMESFGEIKDIFKFQVSESDSYENVVHNVNVHSTLKSNIPNYERRSEKISGSKRSRRYE